MDRRPARRLPSRLPDGYGRDGTFGPDQRLVARESRETAIVGVLTFWLHQKLPYRKIARLHRSPAMVPVVMIGGTALSFAELGWIPQTPTPFGVPELTRKSTVPAQPA